VSYYPPLSLVFNIGVNNTTIKDEFLNKIFAVNLLSFLSINEINLVNNLVIIFGETKFN